MPYATTDDTIAAIATAPGGGLRGVIRVSGPRAIVCAAHCFESFSRDGLPQQGPPRAVSGILRLPAFATGIPCTVAVWPTARSYTRQPVAEIHTLGSPPLLASLLDAVCAAGARLAEPGEFTVRAFLAGRIDLVQAEAVLAVIDAQDQRQLTVALEQLTAGAPRAMTDLREELLELLARLEAGLDFAEEDIEILSQAELAAALQAAIRRLNDLAGGLTRREHHGSEPAVVFIGLPNAGKSSLFNALVGRTAAVTSDEPGTTRDYLTATVDLDGAPCRLIDTAGVQEGSRHLGDALQQAAQQMAAAAVEQADVHVVCIDRSRPLADWDRKQISRGRQPDRLLVLTKGDLPPSADVAQGRYDDSLVVVTSSRSGQGIESLKRRLQAAVRNLAASPSQPQRTMFVASTARRCRESLRLAGESLERARCLSVADDGEELIAAEVRSAATEIGKIVGAVCTEDVLDRVFSRFCIGK